LALVTRKQRTEDREGIRTPGIRVSGNSVDILDRKRFRASIVAAVRGDKRIAGRG